MGIIAYAEFPDTLPHMDEEIGKRLKAARMAAGYRTQREFADKHDIPQPTYALHEGGKRGLRREILLRYAKLMNVSPEWLLTGKGEMVRPANPPEPPPEMADAFEPTAVDIPAPKMMPKDVPVYGVVECGADGAFEMNGAVIDYVRRPPGILHNKHAYAVYATGESMYPRYENGDLVFVNPMRPVTPGCDVVIQMAGTEQCSPNRCYLKRLLRKTGGYILVRQFNPPMDYELPADELIAIHRVMTPAELMGI